LRKSVGRSAFFLEWRLNKPYIVKIVIPQNNPFITAFMKTAPGVPDMGLVVSEIPKNTCIISPGGSVGNTIVMLKRNRKDAAKMAAEIIFS